MHIGLGFEHVPVPAPETPAIVIPAMGSGCSWFAIPLSPAEIEASKVTTGNQTTYTACRPDWVKIAAVGGGAVLLLVLLMRR